MYLRSVFRALRQSGDCPEVGAGGGMTEIRGLALSFTFFHFLLFSFPSLHLDLTYQLLESALCSFLRPALAFMWLESALDLSHNFNAPLSIDLNFTFRLLFFLLFSFHLPFPFSPPLTFLRRKAPGPPYRSGRICSLLFVYFSPGRHVVINWAASFSTLNG